MNKKLVSILILGVISFMLALPVSASQNVLEGIQPRGQECGRCGKMSLHVVKCGSRTSTAEVDCGHGLPFGSDAVKKTYTIYQYKCSNCAYGSSTWEKCTNTEIKCGGYYPN